MSTENVDTVKYSECVKALQKCMFDYCTNALKNKERNQLIEHTRKCCKMVLKKMEHKHKSSIVKDQLIRPTFAVSTRTTDQTDSLQSKLRHLTTLLTPVKNDPDYEPFYQTTTFCYHWLCAFRLVSLHPTISIKHSGDQRLIVYHLSNACHCLLNYKLVDSFVNTEAEQNKMLNSIRSQLKFELIHDATMKSNNGLVRMYMLANTTEIDHTLTMSLK